MTSGKKALAIFALAILTALAVGASQSSLRHHFMNLAASAVWGS